MKAKESSKKKTDKLNKLERAYAEKQISHAEYELWKKVYSNENDVVEEAPVGRKKRRRP